MNPARREHYRRRLLDLSAQVGPDGVSVELLSTASAAAMADLMDDFLQDLGMWQRARQRASGRELDTLPILVIPR